MTTAETVFALLIVLLIGIGCVSLIETKNNFETVCKETGGKAVFDGRQYQCFKETK